MDIQESFYRINVAFKNGDPEKDGNWIHHFCVNITSERKAKKVFAELTQKYALPDYCVDVTFWDTSGSIKKWVMDQHGEVIDYGKFLA